MAWTTPGTATTGDVLTASQWNTDVRDNPSFLYGPPMALASAPGTQAVTTSTGTKVEFDTEEIDTDGMVDLVGNDDRITIKTAGVYQFGINCAIEFNASGDREFYIQKNATPTRIADAMIRATAALGSTRVSLVSRPVEMAVNDYVEFLVFQDSGSTLDIESFEEAFTFAWATWLRGPT